MAYPCGEAQGRALMLVATAIAAGIAQGKSIEDLSLIAALLDVVSDQISLLITVRAGCQDTEGMDNPALPPDRVI